MKICVKLMSCSAILLSFMLLSSGCGRATKSGKIKFMREVQRTTLKPQSGKALVVFIRPQDKVYDIQLSVFRLAPENPMLVGLLASGTRVAYYADPGKLNFMTAALAANSEFLKADVVADRTYFVLVEARLSNWGPAKYTFRPFAPGNQMTAELKQLMQHTRPVENTSEAHGWVQRNMQNLRERQDGYPRHATPDVYIPILRQDDGLRN